MINGSDDLAQKASAAIAGRFPNPPQPQLNVLVRLENLELRASVLEKNIEEALTALHNKLRAIENLLGV